jgi:hypothetical protein
MKRIISLFLLLALSSAHATLNRTSTGLLTREDFTSPSGWTASAGFTAPVAPGGVIFGQLPIVTLARTDGGADSQGVRETQILVDGDYTDLTTPRRLFYGSAPEGSGWRPNLANSTDGGLTFTKLGSWGPALSDGVGGNYAGRDMLYVGKRGGNYVLHAMIGASIFGGGVPASPYTSDIWTATDLTAWASSSFTYVRSGVVLGSSGSFDDGSAYAQSVVPNGGGYELFYSSSRPWPIDSANVGRSTSASSYNGPFTKTGSPVLADSTQYGENPRIFFDTVLGKWIMFQNRATVPGYTDVNVYWMSDSLTDWSAATKVYIMRVCPADAQYAVGLIAPYYIPNDAVIQTSDGFVPVTWDNNPDGTGPVNVHVHRRTVSGVWEPSSHALQYPTGVGSTVNTYTKSVSHTDFVAEWSVQFQETVGSSFAGFDYRVQGGGDSYRITLSVGGGLTLQKSSSGTYSNLQTTTGTLLGIQDFAHRLRVVVTGNVHTAYLDGEQQISYTDSSSPFTSGVSVRFCDKNTQACVRSFSFYSAASVTITSLTNGQTITLRAPGTPPIATGTVSGASYTFTGITHFPAESVEINGVNNVISGGIWGGDSFSASASNPGPNVGPGFFIRRL